MEGYVLHSYGPERYVRNAVASASTILRYDAERPIALFCPPEHQAYLEANGLDTLFSVIAPLPEEHRSIVGFKHHLHHFMPFDRCLFVDSDMIWCRDPEPLWRQLAGHAFTATGLARADFFFGGPKGIGVVWDVLLDRRGQTLRRFGLTHLPRVQAGMIYSSDSETCRIVCETAQFFLASRDRTHFRSRLDEGRSEESCEWSLAMALSRLELPVVPWLQGYSSPQLDYIGGMTYHDEDYTSVRCEYYSDPFVYGLRGLRTPWLRNGLIRLITAIPGRSDKLFVTPFALHFGWLHYKPEYAAFVDRVWASLVRPERAVISLPQ
ncbi:MAG: hypothetical protein ACOCSK_01340 [Rhodothermales bacterium]